MLGEFEAWDLTSRLCATERTLSTPFSILMRTCWPACRDGKVRTRDVPNRMSHKFQNQRASSLISNSDQPRATADVPEEPRLATKIQLAHLMLARAFVAAVPARRNPPIRSDPTAFGDDVTIVHTLYQNAIAAAS